MAKTSPKRRPRVTAEATKRSRDHTLDEAREPGKEQARPASREPVREQAREPARGAVREPAREPARDTGAETQRRKEEHLRIPLEKDVQSIPNPWDTIRLPHRALPEVDKSEVKLDSTFLGRKLSAPIQITGMTGGAPKAKEINDRLAAAAAEHGLAMGVGSQRAALENPKLADTYSVILDHDVPLRMANLGLPQLILWGQGAVGKCEEAMEMVEAHALCIHLNFLQEAVQPEGDTGAKGGLTAIRTVCKELGKPVVVKETGAGMTGATAASIQKVGAAAIDVGGLGGTSFAAVEHWRALDQGDETKARLGKTFWDWGIPTPDSLRQVRSACPGLPVVATGGLRTGLDAARALSLGADMAGFAGHMFRAAAGSRDGATKEAAMVLEELRTALFLMGARTPKDIAGRRTPIEEV